jgi:hypothetical protein
MRAFMVRWLLAILNNRWINASPCRYGYINNVDAFDRSHLESEERQRPGITVATILKEAQAFRACPLRMHTLTVFLDDGTTRDATPEDIEDLRRMMEDKG